jgi:hypothetical protein
MKICPECFSEMAEAAEVCPACTRRVVGKRCPECAEVSREEALKCAHCGHSFARQRKVAAVEKFHAKGELFPTIFVRGRLIPQEIEMDSEKILITTWGVFWLSRTDEEIPWEKIAGYHYRSGFVLG